MISEKRFMILWELAAGAENAKTHCLFETNKMNQLAKSLDIAIKILNAESDADADRIAAECRRKMSSLTGTIQEDWRVGSLVPDESWEIHG